MPKVSVVMSVYNAEKYLREAIESILNQTFKDFEFIIIDDASTDNSLKIIESYKDPRIVMLKNEKNIGLTKSLNRGLKIAKGEYIARMDADDVSLPTRLQKQCSFLDKNSNCAVCGTFVFLIDSQSNIIGKSVKPIKSKDISKELQFNNCLTHGSVMMRKTVLEMVGFYDEEIKRAQDYDLWVRISEIFEIRNLPKFLYCWRNHCENIENKYCDEQRYYVKFARNKIQKKYDSLKENLAVCILFFEKLKQTLECLDSLVSSNVNIYILNNNSSVESRTLLGEYCVNYPQIKIFDSPQNLGVSKGRNFLINNTSEEWLFFLDNDIIVRPKNWFEILSKYLVNLKKYKIFIPKLYNVQDLGYSYFRPFYIKDKRVEYLNDFHGSEINFFPGGASIINRSIFKEYGLYDENMFVGFEDYEFAINAYLQGRPLKAYLIKNVELIHEHKYTKNKNDQQSILVRYNKSHISHSAQYVFQKHGIVIDDNFEEWLKSQIEQQILPKNFLRLKWKIYKLFRRLWR